DRPSWEPELTMPPTPDPQPQINQLQRLWLIFGSPGKVFADIAIKPSWVLAMILLVLLGVAAQFVILPHVDAEATIRARMAERGTELSDEQIEGIVEQSEKFTRFAPAIGIVVGPIAWFIMAAIFFVLLKMVGSDADYVKSLSTAIHAYWPASIVQLVLTSVLIQRMGKMPQNELANVVKSHLGALLSPDAPAWLASAASTISIFNIWTVVLLIIGFATVGKISRGRAAVVTLVPWAVWLVGKAGIAMLTG
ncbi:MAG: Yip1 family protein, partial [Acidobacteriota bacterium]